MKRPRQRTATDASFYSKRRGRTNRPLNWRLTVCDNGIGKTEGQPDKKNSGLGTSIVEALAKQLDARMELSKTPPYGATVSIVHGYLPSRLPRAA
jgi:two-component sensor histidine kinase